MGLYDLVALSTTVLAQSGATVTLASVEGLEVGDRIVIESQHGYDETGLDGDWPIVWNNGSENVPLPFVGAGYYLDVDHVGKSFIGTIQSGGISGNTITLDRTVPTGAVGLPCYRENGAAVKYAIENKLAWPSRKTFAIASSNTAPIRAYLTDEYAEFNFNHCELFAPRGCGALSLSITRDGGGGLKNKRYRNLHLRGNARTSGYGFLAETNVYNQQTSSSPAFGVAGSGGEGGGKAQNVTVENFTFTDNWRSIALANAFDCIVANCNSFFTEPLKRYIQWEYQAATCKRITFYNCVVDSDYARAGFEAFACQGVSFINCQSRNSSFASNASGAVSFRNCSMVWDDVDPDPSFSQYNGLLSLTRTIEDQQGSAQTGTQGGIGVDNFSVTYNAIPYPETNRIFNTVLVSPGIYGIPTAPVIRGIHLTVPRTNVTAPNAGYLVRSDESGTTVTGITGDTLDTGSALTLTA